MLPRGSVDDYELARSAAQSSLDLEPDYQPTVNTLGVALYYVGEYELSIETLERSVKLRTDDTTSLYDDFYLSMSYWKLGNRDRAKHYFDRAIRVMEPDNEEHTRIREEAVELMQAQPILESSH